MQRANPRVVVAHCVGHNLALAAESAEDVPYLADKFDPILLSIYYIFYHYSAERTDTLKDTQATWDDPALTMKR
jgi:hypothetical protein